MAVYTLGVIEQGLVWCSCLDRSIEQGLGRRTWTVQGAVPCRVLVLVLWAMLHWTRLCVLVHSGPWAVHMHVCLLGLVRTAARYPPNHAQVLNSALIPESKP